MSLAEAQRMETEKPSARQEQRRWLPYLTLALLMELLVFVHVLSNDPFTRRVVKGWAWQYDQFRREREFRRQMRYDPPLGAKASEIRIAPANGEVESISAKKATVLVFIGSCTSCVSGDLTKWQEVQDRWRDQLRVIVVSRDSKKRILEFLRQTKLTLLVIPDYDGLISKAYNAVWVPRMYGINRAGNIVWLQKDMAAGLDPQRVTEEIWKYVGGDGQ